MHVFLLFNENKIVTQSQRGPSEAPWSAGLDGAAEKWRGGEGGSRSRASAWKCLGRRSSVAKLAAGAGEPGNVPGIIFFIADGVAYAVCLA